MTPPSTNDGDGKPCVPCMIDGKHIIQPSQANFPVISARTQDIIHYGQNSSTDIAIQAVESAAATFKTYRNTLAHERQKLLLRAADLFESKVEEAMARQMSETSCDEHWARYNAKDAPLFCREAAVAVQTALMGTMTQDYTGQPHMVAKEPVGPVLMIMP
jgi:acyl-CoA reductase-like NAD-dependent aldehyde dehydrogenase